MGKDGEFVDFVVLMGVFVGAHMEYVEKRKQAREKSLYLFIRKPIQSLRKKGFHVLTQTNEDTFISLLPKCDVAWIISGTDPNQNSKPKRASSTGLFVDRSYYR